MGQIKQQKMWMVKNSFTVTEPRQVDCIVMDDETLVLEIVPGGGLGALPREGAHYFETKAEAEKYVNEVNEKINRVSLEDALDKIASLKDGEERDYCAQELYSILNYWGKEDTRWEERWEDYGRWWLETAMKFALKGIIMDKDRRCFRLKDIQQMQYGK